MIAPDGVRALLRRQAAERSALAGPIAGFATYLDSLAVLLSEGASAIVISDLIAELPPEMMQIDARLVQMFGSRWFDEVMEEIRLLDPDGLSS